MEIITDTTLKSAYYEAIVKEFLGEKKEERIFSFETSLGEIICKGFVSTFTEVIDDKITEYPIVRIEVLSGREYIDKLYHWDEIRPSSVKGWIHIELEDPYYGAPEYKIKENPLEIMVEAEGKAEINFQEKMAEHAE